MKKNAARGQRPEVRGLMKAKRTPPSFSLTLPEDTADQVRAALEAAGAEEGYSSINELLTAATTREVRRLQRKYNAGKPWAGIPVGVLRPGRRTTAEAHRASDNQP